MSTGYLYSIIQEDAPGAVCARGHKYFRAGRVRELLLTADNVILAGVTGARHYEVRFENEGDYIFAECNCPYWYREEICKHVVAAALAADAKGLSLQFLQQGDSPWHEDLDTVASRGSQAMGWRERLDTLEEPALSRRAQAEPGQAALFEVRVDPHACRRAGALQLALYRRRLLKSGSFGKATAADWDRIDSYGTMSLPVQRALGRVRSLATTDDLTWRYRHRTGSTIVVPAADAMHALPALAGTVPLFLEDNSEDGTSPLDWNEAPWQFRLAASYEKEGEDEDAEVGLRVRGRLRRGEEERRLGDALLLLAGGVVVFPGEAAPLDDAGAFEWVVNLRTYGPLECKGEERGPLLERLVRAAGTVPLDLGTLPEHGIVPVPTINLAVPKRDAVEAAVHFAYDGIRVSASNPMRFLVEPGSPPRVLARDEAAESTLLEALREVGGAQRGPDWVAFPWGLPAADLAERCRKLLAAGWQIRLEDMPLRGGGALKLRVSSGIDWFDVQGEATFDKSALALPKILKALQEGRGFLPLEDGGAALLPPEWRSRLEAMGALAGKGADADSLRIDRARAPLLDVLLSEFSDVKGDASFTRLRESLRTFDGIRKRREVKAFHGELRPYQREALGWLAFLRSCGLGGCLADDMGLGKTVQILACLVSRKRAKDRSGPTLVVAPRSVLFNWMREAARFTPSLRTATYHGPGRKSVLDDLQALDVIVTTYGTMLRDIDALSAIPFDYAILDESQAIKNAASKTARAARLLQARHRLALSGTPIENNLEELGSLFAFLNPGLLGSRSEFQTLVGSTGTPEPTRMAWLQSALRPVILRRTREQVLTELPDKEEQILRCPLSPKQRRDYDRIREHYRASVLQRIEDKGLAKSKMHVLEALLRLRQAACHPGLIDPARTGEEAAKLEQLLPMLEEIAAAGHKALVFSQFTSFLAIVRDRLEKAGLAYEYMDGRTRKRQERIDSFQEDPSRSVFLISLKAGGTGLNLTAAQYVFLLDPWWNPAVEAQAIGRAHRMGQESRVLVYRLIGEDTVEDRVLELQARKRQLVQEVLGGVSDASLRGISRADLELLLA